MLNPKNSSVTILLPLYNGAPYLKKSIENLLLTVRSEDEILIIDDGSTDLSNSDVKMLEKFDSRIRLERCEHSGLVKTLNYGISRASNEVSLSNIESEQYPLEKSLIISISEDSFDLPCCMVISVLSAMAVTGFCS